MAFITVLVTDSVVSPCLDSLIYCIENLCDSFMLIFSINIFCIIIFLAKKSDYFVIYKENRIILSRCRVLIITLLKYPDV